MKKPTTKKTARKPLSKEQREKKNAALRAARAKKAKPIKFTMGKSNPGKSRYVGPVAKVSKKIVVPVTKKIAQNGFTRPKPTTKNGKPKITYRIWQIADEISAANAVQAKKDGTKAKPASRAQVFAQAVTKEGIAYPTFSNNFYRWRKFNGLFGRIKKDGKPSKPYAPKNGRSHNNEALAKLTGKPPIPGKPPFVSLTSKPAAA